MKNNMCNQWCYIRLLNTELTNFQAIIKINNKLLSMLHNLKYNLEGEYKVIKIQRFLVFVETRKTII